VDDYSTGYVPDYRKKLDDYYQEKTGIIRSKETKDISAEESGSEEEEKFAEELNREIAGKAEDEDLNEQYNKEKRKSISKRLKVKEEAKQKQLTERVLLSYKKRKILRKLRRSNMERTTRIRKLEQRRQHLGSGTAYIDDNTLVYDS